MFNSYLLFLSEKQIIESENLRTAIKNAETFPETLKVVGLEENEWRKLIPFIEQNHNLQQLQLSSKCQKKQNNHQTRLLFKG